MKGNNQYSEDYFTRILSHGEIELCETGKKKSPEVEQAYQILLKSKEFLKARSMIYSIENDPGLPAAQKMVREYFEQEEVKRVRKSRLRNVILIALPASAVLLWLILIIMHSNLTDPLLRMYSWYYTPLQTAEYQNLLIVKEADQSLVAGLEFYEEGNYSLAVEKLNHAESSNYFLGLSYMGMGKYTEAQSRLEESYNENTNHPGVNWYLGLTYLKLSNPNRALKHFRRLFLTDNPYHISASRIVRRLERYIEAETEST